MWCLIDWAAFILKGVVTECKYLHRKPCARLILRNKKSLNTDQKKPTIIVTVNEAKTQCVMTFLENRNEVWNQSECGWAAAFAHDDRLWKSNSKAGSRLDKVTQCSDNTITAEAPWWTGELFREYPAARPTPPPKMTPGEFRVLKSNSFKVNTRNLCLKKKKD